MKGRTPYMSRFEPQTQKGAILGKLRKARSRSRLDGLCALRTTKGNCLAPMCYSPWKTRPLWQDGFCARRKAPSRSGARSPTARTVDLV
jgi:hypothetical protein